MGFVEEPLPKIFQYIIDRIEENDGRITVSEFRQILYNVRIEKQDINDIKKWLEQKGYINSIPGRGNKQGIIELAKTFDFL